MTVRGMTARESIAVGCRPCDVAATTDAPRRHRRRHDRRRGVRGRGRSPTTSTACCRRSSTPARPSARCASSRSPTPAGGATMLAGLGERDEFDAERARVAAAAVARPREGARHAHAVLGGPAPRRRRARRRLVEGTLLAAYAYRAYKSERRRRPRGLDELVVSAHHDVERRRRARGASSPRPPTPRATCRTRPANDLTPDGARRRARAALDRACGVEVLGPRRDRGGRHGRVRRRRAAARHEEPQLITIRYEPADVAGPLLGFVGKARDVRLRRHLDQARGEDDEMKFDMSGGAAVLEAIGAIAAARPAGARRRA